MPVVKMRELLRNPTSVFETLERTREPIVLTRDGDAIASIFPVDPEQAVEIAMAALPDFVESRSRARNARSEGRTSSAEEFRRDYEARHGTGGGTPSATSAAPAPATERSSPIHDPGVGELSALSENLEALFGEALSRELASGLKERIATASAPVLDAAASELREADPGSQDFARRVHELNCELFGSLLPDQLWRTTLDLLASGPLPPTPPESREPSGVFGRPLAEQTLDAVTDRVKSFNCHLLDDPPWQGADVSLRGYEAVIRGAGAIERLSVSSPTPAFWGKRSQHSAHGYAANRAKHRP